MSKFDEISVEEELALEAAVESSIEQRPSFGVAPMVGSSKKVLERYSHCDICGGRLHFVHQTDFSRNTTQEKASCPECGLEARQSLHRLQ